MKTLGLVLTIFFTLKLSAGDIRLGALGSYSLKETNVDNVGIHNQVNNMTETTDTSSKAYTGTASGGFQSKDYGFRVNIGTQIYPENQGTIKDRSLGTVAQTKTTLKSVFYGGDFYLRAERNPFQIFFGLGAESHSVQLSESIEATNTYSHGYKSGTLKGTGQAMVFKYFIGTDYMATSRLGLSTEIGIRSGYVTKYKVDEQYYAGYGIYYNPGEEMKKLDGRTRGVSGTYVSTDLSEVYLALGIVFLL